MRNKAREQILIRLVTLLDGADLGERHEAILGLLHSARRFSQMREPFTAQHYSIKALSQLRKTRLSLTAHGGHESDINLVDSAISTLVLVHQDTQIDVWTILFAHSFGWRFMLFLLFAPSVFSALVMGLLLLRDLH